MNLSSVESEKKQPILDLLIYPKDRDKRIDDRKRLFNFSVIISIIFQWQKERPVLLESDKDLGLLIALTLGEIDEVDEIKQNEGLTIYNHDEEVGEALDVIFFLSSMTRIAGKFGNEADFNEVMCLVNGQSVDSRSLERIKEVAGNITDESLDKDIRYVWILVVSYIIHMQFPVNPTKVLQEYTIPKNSRNYIEELLVKNEVFEKSFGRKMNEEELRSYFSHYRKATRIIRDFIEEYVNPNLKNEGLSVEHYEPYKLYIYNFIYFSATDMTPGKALSMLREQLFTDYADEVESAGGRQEKILIAKR